MNDQDLIARISDLVDEEHHLEQSIQQKGPDEESDQRLQQLELALDQCWDLLRQRRARRDSGANPDEAAVRPPDVVERYQQ